MTMINHQCWHCATTVWVQEIHDGRDEWRGAADADCGCADAATGDDWDDDD